MDEFIERNRMSAKDIVDKFVAAINSHDVNSIGQLMSEDCVYIDSDGTTHDDVEQMIQGWADYFRMFPDYKIEAPEFVVSGETIILLSRASGTYTTDGKLHLENYWEIPAAWKAVIADGKIKLWQVFADNTPLMEIMVKNKKG